MNCKLTNLIYAIWDFTVVLGERKCVGESLAWSVYFLFVAALVKTFKIEAPPKEPLPTLEPNKGFTLAYQGFRTVVHHR